MFNATVPVIAKEVEPHGVLLTIHKIEDFASEGDELRLIDFAFEDGVLDALSIVEAKFCDASQAAGSASAGSGDIVGDEDLHRDYFTRNGG